VVVLPRLRLWIDAKFNAIADQQSGRKAIFGCINADKPPIRNKRHKWSSAREFYNSFLNNNLINHLNLI
jgi:hypothetical protein